MPNDVNNFLFSAASVALGEKHEAGRVVLAGLKSLNATSENNNSAPRQRGQLL
jgi:hypothetical protein